MAPKPSETPTPELIVPGNLIDDYGDLCAKRAEFAPTERAHYKAREALKGLVAGEDPNASFIVRGERYTLTISPCGFESKPDPALVKKKLGAATFLLVVTVAKKALEGWLLKPVIEELCVTTQTGSRSFDAVAISSSEPRR